MFEMFYIASAFDQPVAFDTSRVTTMSMMFESTKHVDQPVAVPFFFFSRACLAYKVLRSTEVTVTHG